MFYLYRSSATIKRTPPSGCTVQGKKAWQTTRSIACCKCECSCGLCLRVVFCYLLCRLFHILPMKVQPNKENQETNSNDKISSKDSQDKSMCKNSSLLLMCKVVDLTGIPQDWKEAFQREFQKSYFQKLFQKVESSQKKDGTDWILYSSSSGLSSCCG